MADDHSEPQDGLDPDEPHTPLWLTFVGAGLFGAVALFVLVTRDPEPPVPVQAVAAPAQTVAIPLPSH